MRKELKDLPKELVDALKKVEDRPTENTPAVIMDFLGEKDAITEIYSNPYTVNTICDYIDESLIDLELDEDKKDENGKVIRKGVENCYQKFAVQVAMKILGLVDLDTKKSKPLDFYDNNPSIKKLKARDFTKLGDMRDLTAEEKAERLEEFYGIKDDEIWKKLTAWEKRLFVDKALSREDTLAEKN